MKWRKRHLEGDTTREEVLICTENVGLCETELGTNIDELLQAGTNRHKRVRQDVKKKRVQVLQNNRIPANEARNWKIQGQKRRITWKEYKRLLNSFELGGFMAQKHLRNVARENMLQDRGALPKEEGDIVREYKAMHEDNLLSTWLREDVDDTEERRKKTDKETREEESRSGKEKRTKERRKRLWLEEGVSPFSRNSVPWRIRTVVEILGETFCMTFVVCLSVCLRFRRVCLLSLRGLIPLPLLVGCDG